MLLRQIVKILQELDAAKRMLASRSVAAVMSISIYSQYAAEGYLDKAHSDGGPKRLLALMTLQQIVGCLKDGLGRNSQRMPHPRMA